MKCSIEKGKGERVFMETDYRSSKLLEVKDWGECVSELMIVKKITRNCAKYRLVGCLYLLYTLHSNLSRAFLASFNFPFVELLLLVRVYCCS